MNEEEIERAYPKERTLAMAETAKNAVDGVLDELVATIAIEAGAMTPGDKNGEASAVFATYNLALRIFTMKLFRRYPILLVTYDANPTLGLMTTQAAINGRIDARRFIEAGIEPGVEQ